MYRKSTSTEDLFCCYVNTFLLFYYKIYLTKFELNIYWAGYLPPVGLNNIIHVLTTI